ncbi:hypothetical protein LINPERPRIM_LOCUS28104 [Linum perenne]
MSGAEVQYGATVNRIYFKVIIQEAIDNGQLSLPFRICNRLFRNQDFPNAIDLRAPNGLVWTVDVVISQNVAENRGRPVLNLSGEVWQDFVEQMRLEHGVFVLLEYVQDATFNTTVLDKWGLEGSYPSDDPNFDRDGPNR